MLSEKSIRVLYINLTDEKVRIEIRSDLYDYLGGVGVASKLLEENIKPGKPPLHEDQPIVFAIGALSSVMPVVTKTVAMFVSPVTGELGESYAGGRLAYTMFNAGFDAIVITGKAKRPSYISITNNRIDIKDARAFWGVDADKTGQYIRTIEGGSGKRSIIRIGPAGENLCAIANVNVDSFRHFGRMGLGAVFGSKKLKAIQVTGDRVELAKDFKKYFQVYNEIYKKVTETPIMAKYHDLGTPINVKVLNGIGALPTRNLQQTSFEHADSISGEAFAEKNLVRKIACVGCPVGCIHIGQVRREFDKGHEYECLNVSYDYELISTLGSYLGIASTDEVLELINAVEEYGLDAVATGVCLAWATEALEKGVVSKDDTIVELKFGDKESYLKAIHYMSHKGNEFYDALSDGLACVTEKFGGFDFAVQVAKNEMPAYHTGYGSVVGYACGARHSHLCNGGYSYDQTIKEFDKKKTVDDLFEEEIKRCILNSLVICLFARNVYDRDTIIKALDAVGRPTSVEELDEIAKRIYASKLRVKEKLGFDLSSIKLPKRIFETPAMGKKLDEATVYEMIEMFKKKNQELLREIESSNIK